MATINKHTRNFTVLLLTSLSIVAFLLFYIFSYIPENERRINERSYRVLQRMGNNMNTSIINYSRYVGNSFVSDAVKKTALSWRTPNQKDSLRLDYQKILSALKAADQNDSLTAKFGLRFYFEEKAAAQTRRSGKENLFYYLQEKGQLYLHFPARVNDRTYQDLRKHRMLLAKNAKDTLYHIKVPVDSLLSSLMRWDTFKHLIVLAREETPLPASNREADKSKVAAASFKVKVIYNSRETADLIPLDTLAYLANRPTGSGPVEVGIAGVPYKLFTLTQRVGADERWYLYGTIPAEKYDTESRAIPAHLVSFLALAVAILIMAFPFLKLVLMNRQERLYRYDLVFSFLSLFSGVALIVLLLFDIYAYYGADRYAERNRLEILSESLEQNLKKEINLLIRHIQIFDKAPPDLENFSPPVKPYWAQVKESRVHKVDSNYFPYFQRIFWVDKTGLMSCSWAAKNQNNARVRVGYREYFKKIKSGGGYSINHSPKFVLESVTSNTDGEKYAVISMESHREASDRDMFRVVALATKLTSLYKAILPLGYGFCLIDKEGKVLFHQNENLNQNENLLEETENNPYLKAALYGRVPVHFMHNYQGNPRLLFVSPVKDLPFFLVTYVNDSYHKAFNVNLLVLTAMFISLYLFSIAILTALIIYLNEGLFDISFSWLWPKRNIARLYFKIILALSSITLLTLFLNNINYQVSTYFIYVLAAVYAFIYIYSSLNQVSFITTLYRCWPIMLAFSVICLLVSPSAFFTSSLLQILLILVLRQLDKLAEKSEPNWYTRFFSKTENIFPNQQAYHYLYAGMLTCWFILASGLPAFVLFRVAYNYEAELMVRYNQVYLAQTLNNIKQAALPEKADLATSKAIYYAGFFYHTKFYAPEEAVPGKMPGNVATTFYRNNNAAAKTNQLQNKAVPVSFNILLANLLNFGRQINNETALLNDIIPVFRPIFRNVLSDEYFLKANELDNWQLKDTDNLQFNDPDQDNRVLLSSHMPNFQVPFIFYRSNQAAGLTEVFNKSGCFFWIDMAIMAILLYLLISFVIRRTFNMELVSGIQKKHWELHMLNLANKNNLFLVALPHSPDIKEIIQKENINYNCYFAEFNLAELGDTTTPVAAQNKLEKTLQEFNSKIWKQKLLQTLKLKHNPVARFLIIRNFDYDPFTRLSLEIKVELLRRLSNVPDTKIILQSTLSPWTWEQQLKKEEYKKEQITGDTAYLLLLQQLLLQLTSYTRTYQSLQQPAVLQTNQPLSLPAYTQNIDAQTELLEVIEKECAAATYLEINFKSMAVNFLKENAGKINFTKEDIIMRLHGFAQLYYRCLWHTCTEEEKYFLFDMAQDGLVNSKNEQVLSSLLGKGLLVTDQEGLLKIMNQSFRYFILTVVDPLEALRFEKNNAQTSRWSMYKTPLVLILIGAVLFFFFTQKTSWANIIAVLTAISSVAAILPRLSILVPSFLVSKEAKSSE